MSSIFQSLLLLLWIVVDLCAICVNSRDPFVDSRDPIQASRNHLALTPPMGFMTWQLFRCNGQGANGPDDNCSNPNTTYCISDALIRGNAQAMFDRGFAKAGYVTMSIDDCGLAGRDPVTHKLQAFNNPAYPQFPGGSYKGTADFVHSLGMKLGAYTAESPISCCGLVASEGYEQLDASTFAEWGVDYLKVDGCNSNYSYYATGYPLMGKYLEESGRDIVYSCSWPDYTMSETGGNVTTVDWSAVMNAGCNQWRTYKDINCNAGELFDIIDHWGDFAGFMSTIHGPSAWFDPDQLLIGSGCLTIEEERSQMAMWCVLAAPLQVSADFRNMTNESASILLNLDAIAVDQDALGAMGQRIEQSSSAPLQRWVKNLADGRVAVVLLNRHGIPEPCPDWNKNTTGYLECCGGCCDGFSNLTIPEAEAACCENGEDCAGFSINKDANETTAGNGCFKANLNCFQASTEYFGYSKVDFPPPLPPPSDIVFNFTDANFGPEESIQVYDVWSNTNRGVFSQSYTARNVAFHDNAFLILKRM